MVDDALKQHIPGVPVKGVISSYRYQPDLFGVHYHVNLYVGCAFGCLVCAAHGRFSLQIAQTCDTVGIKERALELLEKAVSGKRRRGTVMLGGESDPYPEIEGVEELTRSALGSLLKRQFNVVLVTKNSLVVRDADILAQAPPGLRPMVVLQIPTLSDTLAQKLEPHAPPVTQRLQAMATLAERDILVGAYLGPILPYVNDQQDQLIALLEAIKCAGGKFVVVSYSLLLGETQWQIFQTLSNTTFPGLYQKYRDHYDLDYCLPLPDATQLQLAIQKQCDKLNLPYRMEQIEKMRG